MARRLTRRNTLPLILMLALLPVVFPDLDLAVSGWFYTPGEGFLLADTAFGDFVRKGLPPLLIGSVVYAILVWVAGEALKQTFFGIDRRVTAYLVLSLAVGPGLVVNTLLKDNWGRARPSQITEFGGQAQFSPALMISDQCQTNCSFTSGHGALGFWVVALALLAPPAWRNRAVGAALAFGAAVGFVRIAQGGHFFSDVVFSALITVGIAWGLKRLLLGSSRIAAHTEPPPAILPKES